MLVRVTAPDPIWTVAEVKKHLDVEHSDHDWLIDAYIQAATEMLDGPNSYTHRALGPQTWDWYPDLTALNCGWESRRMEIPLPPLIDVSAVEYRDSSGNLTAFTTYNAQGANGAGHGWIWPDDGVSWPTTQTAGDAFRVRFRCGYAVSNGESPDHLIAAVPAPLKAAILLMVGDLYANRETVAEGSVSAIPMSTTVERLIAPYRYIGFA